MTTVTRSLPKAAPRPLALRRPKRITGFASWFTTVDHKKIGVLYGTTAVVFFVLGGVEALLIRVQLFQAHRRIRGRLRGEVLLREVERHARHAPVVVLGDALLDPRPEVRVLGQEPVVRAAA